MQASLRRQLLHFATNLAALRALPPSSLGHRFALWLHQRVRHTHDLWHVVAGCPPSPAGEAALSAINMMQLRWPGSAMLLAQRWEEGWALPLAEWRERLGIAAVVARSPFGGSGGG